MIDEAAAHNPSVERVRRGTPGRTAHVERYAALIGSSS